MDSYFERYEYDTEKAANVSQRNCLIRKAVFARFFSDCSPELQAAYVSRTQFRKARFCTSAYLDWECVGGSVHEQYF